MGPVSTEDDTNFIDTFISEEVTTDSQLIESLENEINRSMEILDERKRIDMYVFGIGKSHEYTLDEIGERSISLEGHVNQRKH